ncbi:hypothetical protein F0562_025511 [Nyssa sinensis]|uniref:Uncharacterized protein n=1 Tax=Nyssa sinensis TaxID=561372 RepID=A0A5J5B807_9ASTE|nr:hypothetical protein F0562_025511 [Nyssa sinensis]
MGSMRYMGEVFGDCDAELMLDDWMGEELMLQQGVLGTDFDAEVQMGRHGSSRFVDDSVGLSEQLMKIIQKPCMPGDYGNYCTAEAHKKGLEEFDGTEAGEIMLAVAKMSYRGPMGVIFLQAVGRIVFCSGANEDFALRSGC